MRFIASLMALIVVLSSSVSSAHSLKLVGSVTIDSKELLSRSQTMPTEFVLPNKKTVGKFHALDVYEILKPQLKTLSPAELRNTIIVAESSTGATSTFSAADILPETSKLPAMLLLTSAAVQNGKVAPIQDSAINNGRVDLSKLDAISGDMTRRRVGLQLSSAAKGGQTLNPFSVIFPIDARTDRWISDVKILTIYVVTP